MRFALILIACFVPADPQGQDATTQKAKTLEWVLALEDANGGFYAAPQEPGSTAKPQPSLRATSSAVRAIHYLGGELPNKEKHAVFVLGCFDARTGAFSEPGGKADPAIVSVGVMVAVELGVPKEKFAKALDYLKDNAKTFEEVRIAAAAVEAWGVKDCPFKLDAWVKIATDHIHEAISAQADSEKLREGLAREVGSSLALILRLDPSKKESEAAGIGFLENLILDGQRSDGGWGKAGEKASDIETTYRVMRSLMLLQRKPKDVAGLRKFLAAHRNEDGGYATKPGEKSNISGVYYVAIVTKWLDAMEK
jgi:prenyltransferase beta subunit